MKKQPVWVFGNPDFAADALPLKILPRLQAALPQFEFFTKDPHDEWDLPSHLIIIDAVKGITAPLVATTLNAFQDSPRVTLHDFDLITNLRWLAKLGRLPPFTIIGLPMHYSPAAALAAVIHELKSFNSSSLARSERRSSCTDHKP